MSFCGQRTPPDLPDAGDGACCDGAAYYGPNRCTCWEPVYDLVQEPPLTELVESVMPGRCGDCAFRPDSPERRSDPTAAADWEGLQALVHSGTPFYCHDGVKRPVKWVHPTGVEIPGSGMDYTPLMHAGRGYRADGRPMDLCAGWTSACLAAARRQTISRTG